MYEYSRFLPAHIRYEPDRLITDRDYSVTLGLTVFLGVMIIGCNLIVDIMYAVIDPRVKITE